MSAELILAIAGILVSILSSGGIVAWITTRANKQLTDANATKILTDSAKGLLEDYRTQGNEMEAKIERLSSRVLELESEIKAQDAAIEELNGRFLKMELGYIINENAVRARGYDPVIALTDLPNFDINNMRLIAEGQSSARERRLRSTEKKAAND